ncbi:MAG: hypothetical protein J0L87_12505 [Bacteroidetes bacterium]|nr:hypothetical protein [Bacteroidota bacterium]
MAHKITKREEYSTGIGNLKITAFSGDANHSDITISINDIPVVNDFNKIENFDLGAVENLKNKDILAYARISKTGLGDHVSFTVKLNDNSKSEVYAYSTEEEDDIIKYYVFIRIK